MTDEVKDALWEAIEKYRSLRDAATNCAANADYEAAFKCELEANGVRTAVFVMLGSLGERPVEMVSALEQD